jgi:hypothetical protein
MSNSQFRRRRSDNEFMGDNSKLNTIILGVATFGITTLIGVAMSKIDNVDEKVEILRDNQQKMQLDTAQRLTKVETKMDQVIVETKK